MSFTALLDTNVLFPIGLCDTLLSIAEAGVYDPRWSGDILRELSENLHEKYPEVPALEWDNRVQQMERAFPYARIEGYEGLISSMTNHEKDRHVLAAAVVGRVGVIVSNNVKDFPRSSYETYGLEIQTADEFLVHAVSLDPFAILNALQEQSDARNRPPKSILEILAALEKLVPQYVEAVRALLWHDELQSGHDA